MLLRLGLAADSSALYLIREVTNTPERTFAGWQMTTLAQILAGCGWNLEAGGPSMIRGQPTQTTMLPPTMFSPVTVETIDAGWVIEHGSLRVSFERVVSGQALRFTIVGCGKMLEPEYKLTNGYLTLDQITGHMQDLGVIRLYIKWLAENDNSKNQIYLGPDFSALNILPHRDVVSDDRAQRANFKSRLNLLWLQTDGGLSPAPGAQLILYPDYPEVRMSGFLRGSTDAPSELLRQGARIRDRVLFLGVRPDDSIVAYVVPPASAAAQSLREATEREVAGVFQVVPLPVVGAISDARAMLLGELGRIYRLGWIDSKRLTSQGDEVACNATNCGGYTLEAELGITPNGTAEPDYLGWEIKQHAVTNLSRPDSGGAITLMTPEPNQGYYWERGAIEFVRRYGYAARNGQPDRLNFGGIHRLGLRHATTGLMLLTRGYDYGQGKIDDVNGGVYLIADDGEVAAGWSFSTVLSLWGRKHNLAAYVPSMKQNANRLQYRYGDVIRMGEHTSAILLLNAIHAGKVYYDPGIKVERMSASPVAKRRSQFRVLPRDLPSLYEQIVDEKVT